VVAIKIEKLQQENVAQHGKNGKSSLSLLQELQK
jgi:hypothetical protein